MSNQNSTDPAPAAAAAPKQKNFGQLLTRLIVIVIVLLVTAAALAVGIPWGRYRVNNVVVSEAVVKGTVTKIGARIDGRIKSVEAEPGQKVSRGDVLLKMEDRHLLAALDKARGEVESVIKDLESEKMGIEQTGRRLNLEIDRVNATRKKAAGELAAQKSTLALLEKQRDRMALLLKTGAAATNDLDRVTSDRDKALGLVDAAGGVAEAAEFNHQKAMNELEGLRVREAKLEVLEAQITVARAKVAMAEADVEATMIKAPEDGRVLERIVGPGGSAKVGEPMISLWVGRAWVEAWVNEQDLWKFKVGSSVDVSLDSNPNRKLAGRVESLGLASDKQIQLTPVPSTLHSFTHQSAMVPVRIALEEDNSRLQLGLSVLVGIKKDSGESETGDRPLLSRLFSWVPGTGAKN